jgi:hypothetical protein
MFCPKCGVETPDDSQFCRKCGSSLAVVSTTGGRAVAAAPAPVKTKAVRTGFVVALLVVLAFIGWMIVSAQQKAALSGRTQGSLLPAIMSTLRTMNIGTGALSVGALQYRYYTLVVPAGASNVKVQGHFTATGGTGNDIVVFLVNDESFTNWKNHHQSSAYYNSGKETVGDVAATLPDGGGNYYLIFDNRFSLLTAKAVEFTGTMTYYQ